VRLLKDTGPVTVRDVVDIFEEENDVVDIVLKVAKEVTTNGPTILIEDVNIDGPE
jgi:predicted Zn-ribbon and HTH transcriptional regulator